MFQRVSQSAGDAFELVSNITEEPLQPNENLKTACFQKPAKSKQIRSINQFIEDQNIYYQNNMELKEKLIKEDNQRFKECTFKPKINKYKSPHRGTVSHRQTNQTNISEQQNFQNKKSKLTKDQVMQVSLKLYEDAKQRQNNQIQMQSIPQKDNTNLTSTKSEKLLCAKFIIEYEEKVKLFLEDSEPLINQENMINVLQELKMVKENEQSLILVLWETLQGDFLKGISKRNLCQFLLIIIGVLNFSLKKDYVNSSDDDKSTFQCKFGQFDKNGNWNVQNIHSARQLQSFFSVFMANRLLLKKKEKIFKTEGQDENSLYQPAINKNSFNLANKHREKILQDTANLINNDEIICRNIPENGKITHADLLILQKQGQMANRDKQKRYKEINAIKECSFQPNMQNYQYLEKSQGVKTSLKLFQLSKQNQLNQIQENNSQQNYEYYSFQPQISQLPRNTFQSVEQIKGVDKSIQRMAQAQYERGNKNKWFQRGYNMPEFYENKFKNNSVSAKSYQYSQCGQHSQQYSNYYISQNHTENSKSKLERLEPESQRQRNSPQAPQPLLYVDVNLGPGRSERLVVYQGDNSHELAENFGSLYGLDSNMKQKLQELLESQIQQLLLKIIEEKEE